MSLLRTIAAHRAAWQAFQDADAAEAGRAEDREADALMRMLATPAQSLHELHALAAHLAWYCVEESEQAGEQAHAFLAALHWLPALASAQILLDAVDFDNNGATIAGQFVGGNGGLISRDTIKAADELRKALAGAP